MAKYPLVTFWIVRLHWGIKIMTICLNYYQQNITIKQSVLTFTQEADNKDEFEELERHYWTGEKLESITR